MATRLLRVPRLAAAVALVAAAVCLSGYAQTAKSDSVSSYLPISRRIAMAALLGNEALSNLHVLCHSVGHRLSGSPGEAKAIPWAVDALKRAGCDRVTTEPVAVPTWSRGHTSVKLLTPVIEDLPALALGGSVGTTSGPIEADVVVARSFNDLERLGKLGIQGKIVVYDVPWDGYGKTVRFRSDGASRAAEYGAVAVLTRSAGFGGTRTPHTGAMTYADGVAKIPAAALAFEDAGRIGKYASAGVAVRMRIDLGCRTSADSMGANVIGDYFGSDRPDEIVLLGAHLDSWDVGHGAQDDGGGVVSVIEAVAVLKRLGLRPRRTIRVVLFANEENGLRGARAYAAAHAPTMKLHVAAIENDGGVEKPVGFGMNFPKGTLATDPRAVAFRDIVGLLEPLGAANAAMEGGGADIGQLGPYGVPLMSINTVGSRYFEWHHTELDTFDKIVPSELDKHVAVHSIMAFVLADMTTTLR